MISSKTMAPSRDGGADDAAAVLAEQVDEDLEVGAGQEGRSLEGRPVAPEGSGPGHHVFTCSVAKRSSIWRRVA